MSEIIFVRTRTPYDSYQDFWRLVELSGFPLIYIDEVPREGVQDNVYIITPANGEWQHGIQTDAHKVIHWQLEWCIHPNDSPNSPPGVTETWSHDAWQAKNIGARYVPIGSHPDLVHTPLNGPCPIEHDAALLSYMSYRRQVTAYEMQQRGIRLAPNAWGAERHHILTHSKAIVHIHQHDDIPGVAALRIALAAAYRLPVITETCADYGIFGYGDLLRCDYAHMAEFVDMWTRRNETRMLEDFGHSLYQKLCVEQTFRKVIEGVV
jgi:hypothetical protein